MKRSISSKREPPAPTNRARPGEHGVVRVRPGGIGWGSTAFLVSVQQLASCGSAQNLWGEHAKFGRPTSVADLEAIMMA